MDNANAPRSTLTNSDVIGAERKAYNYWFVDGLFNIIGGTGFLLLVTSFELGKKTAVTFLVSACCYFLLLVLILRREQVLEWLKTRITYPRTGYVPSPYKRPPKITELRVDDPYKEVAPDIRRARRNRQLRSIPGMVTLAAAFVLLYGVKGPWICLPAGALYGVALWLINSNGVHPLPDIFAMSLAGLGVSLLRVTDLQRIDMLSAAAGIILLTEGTITLLGYLWRNPAAHR